MGVRHAQAQLLGQCDLRRRAHGPAAHLPRGVTAGPGSILGSQPGTRGQRRAKAFVRRIARGAGGQAGRTRDDRAHDGEHTRAGPEATRTARSAGGAEAPEPADGLNSNNPGDDLFSRKAALSVSSALESLTTVFGMGTGVASPLESPGLCASGS